MEINIASAKYLDSTNTAIIAEIGDETWSVPPDPDNRHYAEILRQVEAGDLTIEDAGE
tara:strand:- start:967 stop:1140 length:174 start_codon:yes stop_codon:yes gene_type:complete